MLCSADLGARGPKPRLSGGSAICACDMPTGAGITQNSVRSSAEHLVQECVCAHPKFPATSPGSPWLLSERRVGVNVLAAYISRPDHTKITARPDPRSAAPSLFAPRLVRHPEGVGRESHARIRPAAAENDHILDRHTHAPHQVPQARARDNVAPLPRRPWRRRAVLRTCSRKLRDAVRRATLHGERGALSRPASKAPPREGARHEQRAGKTPRNARAARAECAIDAPYTPN